MRELIKAIFHTIVCDLLTKTSTSHILEKIELRLESATFDLATEQFSKHSMVQLPRYSLKCMPHMQNYFLC